MRRLKNWFWTKMFAKAGRKFFSTYRSMAHPTDDDWIIVQAFYHEDDDLFVFCAQVVMENWEQSKEYLNL